MFLDGKKNIGQRECTTRVYVCFLFLGKQNFSFIQKKTYARNCTKQSVKSFMTEFLMIMIILAWIQRIKTCTNRLHNHLVRVYTFRSKVNRSLNSKWTFNCWLYNFFSLQTTILFSMFYACWIVQLAVCNWILKKKKKKKKQHKHTFYLIVFSIHCSSHVHVHASLKSIFGNNHIH